MTERRKRFAILILTLMVSLAGIIGLSAFWLQEYRHASYIHVSAFCQSLIEDHPETEAQVLSTLKKYQSYGEQQIGSDDFLSRYGYQKNDFSEGIKQKAVLLTIAAFLIIMIPFLWFLWDMNRRNRMRIMKLTNYLEEVNIGSSGTLIPMEEDAFSHLQDEMYKTVTALHQTKEDAVKARGNYADNLANIAHQLKTPITAAFLSLQLMRKDKPSEYADQIQRQLERLSHLEEALLTLSRIDAGVLQLEHTPVDIYTALNLAAENLEEMFAKEIVTISIPNKGCIEIYGDLEWTMEALMNLMKNCAEHSPSGGTIHCDYFRNPLYVEILIWDDGPGFLPEDIPHLFERFYRGNRAVGNGIGIGLSLARSILELQNGNITARNLPERGACFEIRIYSH